MKPLLEREDIDLEMSPVDFMRGEFMKDQDLSKDESLINLTIEAYSKALEKLKESRLIEGKKLQAVITGHIKNYTENFKIIESLADEFQQSVEEKIRKRFEELLKDVKVDEPRFMQEVVYYLEKMDVHEEINRITGHLSKLDKLLSASGEVGRQIDFMMQELGRETNTIGSKSNMKQISETVVQMKVHLEKIREQSLNLE